MAARNRPQHATTTQVAAALGYERRDGLTAAGQAVVGVVARAVSTIGKRSRSRRTGVLKAGRPKKKRKGNGHGNGK
jgi:hypothetical protein